MEKEKWSLIVFTGWCAFCYLCFSLLGWSLNAGEWSEGAREGITFLLISSGIMGLLIYGMSKIQPK